MAKLWPDPGRAVMGKANTGGQGIMTASPVSFSPSENFPMRHCGVPSYYPARHINYELHEMFPSTWYGDMNIQIVAYNASSTPSYRAMIAAQMCNS